MKTHEPQRLERLTPHERRTRRLNVAILVLILAAVLAALYHGKLGTLTRAIQELNPAPASRSYVLHLVSPQSDLDFTGLRRKSTVTLNGLKVGMVESISFALDSRTQTLDVTVVAHLDRFGPDEYVLLAPEATLHHSGLSPDFAGASIALRLDPQGKTPLRRGTPHQLTLVSARGGKDDPLQPLRDAAQRVTIAIESTAAEYRALAASLHQPIPETGPLGPLQETLAGFRETSRQWQATALALQTTAEQWRETGGEFGTQLDLSEGDSALARVHLFFDRTEAFFQQTRRQMERVEASLSPTLTETRLFLNESTDLINRFGDTFFARFIVRPKALRPLAPVAAPPRLPIRKARPVRSEPRHPD